MRFGRRSGWALGCAVGLLLAATTGCQVDVGGQTLPSPYYMSDDIQYFAPGPEFLLSKEAAALRMARDEQGLLARPAAGAPAPMP